MRITDIECIPIVMPLAERYSNHQGRVRMGNIDEHLVVKVHTDNGLDSDTAIMKTPPIQFHSRLSTHSSVAALSTFSITILIWHSVWRFTM